MQWLLTPTDNVNKSHHELLTPPDHVNLCTREWYCFAVIIDCRIYRLRNRSLYNLRCDNVVFNDRVRLRADRFRGTDEIQDKEAIWFGEANTSNDEVENMNSEDFLARGRLKIANSVEESFSNSFQ